MWTLELNDAEITAERDHDLVYHEPGIALVQEGSVEFGNAALEQSRLHPRLSHTQFWQRMNAEPVNPPGANVQNHADLVYLHLCHLRDDAGIQANDPVRIAVPSAANNEQLSLLLGIAQEASISIRALIDASVAAASTLPLPPSCKCIDVSLHRATITTIDVDEYVTRRNVAEVPEAGISNLIEGWIDVIADRFVSETRFDPLRIAATEQQVFNQIYSYLTADEAELTIDVTHEGESRQVTTNNADLSNKSSQRFDLLSKEIGEPTTLVLTHRVQRLPGLAERLENAGHRIVALDQGAATRAIREQSEQLSDEDGAVIFATQLISAGRLSEAPTQRANVPTHLLCGATAIPLGANLAASSHPECRGLDAAFRLKRDDGGYSLHPEANANVAINGNRIDTSKAVEAGDVVRTGAIEFRLIAVTADG